MALDLKDFYGPNADYIYKAKEVDALVSELETKIKKQENLLEAASRVEKCYKTSYKQNKYSLWITRKINAENVQKRWRTILDFTRDSVFLPKTLYTINGYVDESRKDKNVRTAHDWYWLLEKVILLCERKAKEFK